MMDEELKAHLDQMEKRIDDKMNRVSGRIHDAETRMLRAFMGLVPVEPTYSDMKEFWEGLGRLYDSSVKLQAVCEELAATAKSHEGRLDHIEVVQQWLADAERKRDKEKGQ